VKYYTHTLPFIRRGYHQTFLSYISFFLILQFRVLIFRGSDFKEDLNCC